MDFAIGSWQAEDQFMPDWAGQLRSDMNPCWEMCRSVKASFEPPKIHLIGIKLNKLNSYLVLERKKIIEEYLRKKPKQNSVARGNSCSEIHFGETFFCFINGELMSARTLLGNGREQHNSNSNQSPSCKDTSALAADISSENSGSLVYTGWPPC